MRTYSEPAQNIPASRDVDVIVVDGCPAGLGAYPNGKTVRRLRRLDH